MAKRDHISEHDTSQIETKSMAQEIERIVAMCQGQNKRFRRHWYDNNFFDDGYHFRFVHRTTNRIVDLSKDSDLYHPLRAIPKASRQIRGVVNLLIGNEPIPVVYPEKIERANYSEPVAPLEEGQKSEYQMATDEASQVAKKAGHWIQEEWKKQHLMIKLALMGLLTAKHSVSFLQIWADDVEEKIKTQVYDAFDISLLGNLTSIYDSPFIGKNIPKTIKEIKANPIFDKEQLDKITPDNKYASDEVKEAYLVSKYGMQTTSDSAATLILREFFIKEYLNSDNRKRIRSQSDSEEILKEKEDGDIVIRHVYVAGGVWLYDQYTSLSEYPFVDLKFEPGPIYQIPLIERFMPANKSLDTVASRLERYIHTMVAGIWMQRGTENFKITNTPGGQVIKYKTIPPTQGKIAPIPAFLFEFMSLLTGWIEEQGVTTTALGKIPRGVKAHAAIESLKASEYGNLAIAFNQLKDTIRRISERFLDIADKYFVTPQTVYWLDKGEPDYFDVIGQNGIDTRKKIKEEVVPGTVPLKGDYKVDIQIESGMGYTVEGKKARAIELAGFIRDLAKEGYVTVEAVKLFVEKLLDVFGFGATAEFMDAMKGLEFQQGMAGKEKEELKIALLEVIRDLQQASQAPPEGAGAGTGVTPAQPVGPGVEGGV